MLLGGKKPVHNVRLLVLPREGDVKIVFKCGAVTDMETFEKLCPTPTPPKITLPGNVQGVDLEDKAYKMALSQMGDRRWDYIILKSLEATPDLVWETVKLSDPETWSNWRREAMESGLSHFEVNRLVATVMEANSLSEGLLEEARKSFLAGQVQA